MRIASFNLESLDIKPGADAAIEDRIAILRPQLMRLDADILCLQEINGQKPESGGPRELIALRQLIAETPYAGYHLASTWREDGGVRDVHNLVILSRYPLGSVRQIHHDLVPPPRYGPVTATETTAPDGDLICWDRPILTCVVSLPEGQSLHVFNVHLRAPRAAPVSGQKVSAESWKSVSGWAEGYFLSAIKRTGQALELRLAIDAVFDAEPGALLAVCGDFNAREDETPLIIVSGSDERTGTGALAGRMLTPLERSLPRDRRFTIVHRGRPQMVDHILVSRALLGRFTELQIHNELLQDELLWERNGVQPPDSLHAPLVATFRF